MDMSKTNKEPEMVAIEDTQEKPKVKEHNNKILHLSKLYMFEGTKHEMLDLSGIEKLTGADMVAINQQLRSRGIDEATPEITLEYAFFVAAKVASLPLEFFDGLPMNDCFKVRGIVRNFFLA